MRVIAGTAGGLRLVGPSSEATRPISDRAKEALFNILGPLPGVRFADLFAGTGAVGIEALSRGAAHATFVERDRTALDDIGENLERTGLAGGATIVRGDVFGHLARAEAQWDVVFVGPPQWDGLWSRTLEALDARPELLDDEAVVVAQLDPREDDEALALSHLARRDTRTYGRVRLAFYGPPIA